MNACGLTQDLDDTFERLFRKRAQRTSNVYLPASVLNLHSESSLPYEVRRFNFNEDQRLYINHESVADAYSESSCLRDIWPQYDGSHRYPATAICWRSDRR